MQRIFKESPYISLLHAVSSTAQQSYLEKDQYKSNESTKFIGRGNGSTGEYARLTKAHGVSVNGGEYNKEDVVFISANGNRAGRIDPDFVEIKKAIEAGATLLTDASSQRPESGRTYNIGEQQVAEFLRNHGYQESSLEFRSMVARWCPIGHEPVKIYKGGGIPQGDIIKEWSKLISIMDPRVGEDMLKEGIAECLYKVIHSNELFADGNWKRSRTFIDLETREEHGLAIFIERSINTRDTIDSVRISNATNKWEFTAPTEFLTLGDAYQRYIEKKLVGNKYSAAAILTKFNVDKKLNSASSPPDRSYYRDTKSISIV